MKSSKEQLDKLEKALIAAHRRQEEEVQFPADWRERLMRDLRQKAIPEPASRISRRPLAWAAAALVVIFGWLIVTNLDWYDPWIKVQPVIVFVDSRANFNLEAGDVDSGLRHLRVCIIQGGQQREVLDQEVKQPRRFLGLFGPTTKKVQIKVVLDANALKLHEGPAKLVVEAHDLSWRNNFQGRLTTMEKEIMVQPEGSF